MATKKISRRQAITAASAGALGTFVNWSFPSFTIKSSVQQKLAINGGEKVHTGIWPEWPVWDQSAEKNINEMLRTGRWWRGNGEHVADFEQRYAELMGVKRCLATASGTTALITALKAIGVDAGDEVLVSPFTFIASYNVIFMNKALPVFVDSDPDTFLMDPAKIESRITDRTTAILPVHIYGLPVDMDKIVAIAAKHNLKVIEDACQGWLGEYKGKMLGSLGDAGCFSFQNSKNIPIGECGAIVSDDDEYMDRCYSYHNYGNPYGTVIGEVGAGTVMAGTKLRITEYQAAIGLAQLKRLDAQTTIRHKSAEYLKSRIGRIPGILTYKLNPGVTRVSYHIFPFRYRKQEFRGLSREQFIRALEAEGIPSWGGYTPLNKMPYLKNAFLSKNFKLMYQPEMLDYDKYMERNQCPLNDQLCEEAVWLMQNILLGDRSDMDDIANAIERIHKNAEKIKNALS